jgi:hypothetical protein
MIFQIKRIASKNPLPQNDGLKHYLVYKRDTLAIVNEPKDFDIVDIKFERVGLDPIELAKPHPDSVIKGFLVIRNSVGGELTGSPVNNEREGNILLNITSENSIYKGPTISIQKKVTLKLDKIECHSIKEDEAYGEVYGYVGARISSPHSAIKNIAIFPSDKDILLWSRLDQEGLPLKKGDILLEMGAKNFVADNDAIIEIKSDLNEDDDNSNNETMSDDGDDQLSKDGLVKTTKYRVMDLSVNHATHFTQGFYNEGKRTEIILYFTITSQNVYEKQQSDSE